MNKKELEALEIIENQLYAINARNISLRWIGMQHKPTMADIMDLNSMLAFLIKEIRTLRETGKLDVDDVHRRHMERDHHREAKFVFEVGSKELPERGCPHCSCDTCCHCGKEKNG